MITLVTYSPLSIMASCQEDREKDREREVAKERRINLGTNLRDPARLPVVKYATQKKKHFFNLNLLFCIDHVSNKVFDLFTFMAFNICHRDNSVSMCL